MLELFKLKAAHLLASNSRLAKKIFNTDLRIGQKENNIKIKMRRFELYVQQGGDRKKITESARVLVTLIHNYFKEVVFVIEDDLELYLLRDEKDVVELYNGLREVLRLVASNEKDAQAKKELEELITKTHKEGQEFVSSQKAILKRVRDQKRESEHLRDHTFTLNEGFDMRKASRQLRSQAHNHHKDNVKEKKLLHESEHHIKLAHTLQKKDSTDVAQEEQKVNELITQLVPIISDDFKQLKEAIKNTDLLMRFAVNHFFRAEEMEHQLYRVLQELHSAGLYDEDYKYIKRLILEEENWLKKRDRQGYKTARKIRNQARHDAGHEKAA